MKCLEEVKAGGRFKGVSDENKARGQMMFDILVEDSRSSRVGACLCGNSCERKLYFNFHLLVTI